MVASGCTGSLAKEATAAWRGVGGSGLLLSNGSSMAFSAVSRVAADVGDRQKTIP